MKLKEWKFDLVDKDKQLEIEKKYTIGGVNFDAVVISILMKV